MTRRGGGPRFRWVVPYFAVVAMPDTLVRAGGGSADRGVLVSLVVGLAAGAFWYWSFPRPLGERFALLPYYWLFLLGLAAVAATSASISFDSPMLDEPEALAALAVPCGLVLAEQLHRRRSAEVGSPLATNEPEDRPAPAA